MMAVVVWGGEKMVVKGEGAHIALWRASDEPWYGALGMVVSALRKVEKEETRAVKRKERREVVEEENEMKIRTRKK